MLDLVQEIAQSENQIVLLVTHAPEDAIRICKETLFISGGKVWSAGETRRALNQIPDEMRDYFG
jgi:ABC-type thiamine transport system ATPase subunit